MIGMHAQLGGGSQQRADALRGRELERYLQRGLTLQESILDAPLDDLCPDELVKVARIFRESRSACEKSRAGWPKKARYRDAVSRVRVGCAFIGVR